MTDQDTDKALVARVVKHGDQRAFHILYTRHTPRLLRVARNLRADDDPDPGELVQDTWIRAADKFADFEWRALFFTWLTGILVNLLREAYRKRHRVDLVELTESISEWPPPPDASSLIDLEHALGQLGAGARTILVLHDVHGYTHEEIAGFLGIALGTSKSQLCRARRAVVQLMTSERKSRNHANT